SGKKHTCAVRDTRWCIDNWASIITPRLRTTSTGSIIGLLEKTRMALLHGGILWILDAVPNITSDISILYESFKRLLRHFCLAREIVAFEDQFVFKIAVFV